MAKQTCRKTGNAERGVDPGYFGLGRDMGFSGDHLFAFASAMQDIDNESDDLDLDGSAGLDGDAQAQCGKG